jgi:hypothetical protein
MANDKVELLSLGHRIPAEMQGPGVEANRHVSKFNKVIFDRHSLPRFVLRVNYRHTESQP